MPPGIIGRHLLPMASVLMTVAKANRAAAPIAHSLARYGSPEPVTSRAVKIQT
jgi:hypothetical protein